MGDFPSNVLPKPCVFDLEIHICNSSNPFIVLNLMTLRKSEYSGVIAHTSGTSIEEAEAGGLPSVPGQYELQNEHLTKNKEERNREGENKNKDGRREEERVRILK